MSALPQGFRGLRGVAKEARGETGEPVNATTAPIDGMPVLVDAGSIARMLCVSRCWVLDHTEGDRRRSRVPKGPRIPAKRLGHLVRYDLEEVKKWLETL